MIMRVRLFDARKQLIDLLVKQLAENQMLCVQMMNNIANQLREIVYSKIVTI